MPDFIPVLGYLDDLILIPLAIAIVIKMIPKPVMADCREKAPAAIAQGGPGSRVAASIIITIWLIVGALAAILNISNN